MKQKLSSILPFNVLNVLEENISLKTDVKSVK